MLHNRTHILSLLRADKSVLWMHPDMKYPLMLLLYTIVRGLAIIMNLCLVVIAPGLKTEVHHRTEGSSNACEIRPRQETAISTVLFSA